MYEELLTLLIMTPLEHSVMRQEAESLTIVLLCSNVKPHSILAVPLSMNDNTMLALSMGFGSIVQ